MMLDPNYAMGHAVMADLLNLRIGQGWSHDVAADAQAVDRMAHAAIESDPYNARALAIQGHNRSYLHRDYEMAKELFDRAQDVAPNDASVWMWSACTYAYVGEGQEAVRRAERALRLSPKDTFLFRYHATLCLAHYTAGSFENAAYWGRLGIREAPAYTSNIRFTIASLIALAQLDEARELGTTILAVQPNFRAFDVIEGHPYQDVASRRRIAQALIEAGLPD